MSWLFALIVLLMAQKEYLATPTPLKLPGFTNKLTPYIKHWEAANFNREALHQAHLKHIEQARTRRKRELDTRGHELANTIRLNFSAHDRDFRLILRQHPSSVFASDVEIENTLGPIDYDVSRVYTGTLEDDDSSHVHAILTSDNLLDGTIETNAEHYYLEPSHRYSSQLAESGVHSIVYKVSDVNDGGHKSAGISSATHEHCASERLRRKRWLPDELSTFDSRNPPLPLDLEVPYNDDFRVLAEDAGLREDEAKRNADQQQKKTTTTLTPRISDMRSTESFLANFGQTTPNRNILVNNYNPSNNNGDNGDSRSYNSNNNNNNNGNADNANSNNQRKYYTKHKNIIVSTYNRPGSETEYTFDDSSPSSSSSFPNASSTHNLPTNFFNSNWTTMFMTPSNDRPSHKTHVEIITKNGATKKPNIIINNYNPEITFAPNPHNPSFNSMLMTNLLSGRGQDPGGDINSSPRLLYDRKTTCMLYLQADHTFFQKMGSDEASIEAITRHVQRANSIYKNTDFNNDGKPDNITFMIKRIKVHNMNAIKDPGYRFPGNYGVEKFLELFSEEDYDAFCLAYMFTYRDFEMGTLGLAWTGDLKNAGGVCEKNGHYRGSLKSLNTGIVTLLNYGKHVPPAVSHVTLAHEIGHNFGSPHDPEQCTPGGEDGNFIMFARATSGDKKNNNKFSTCSLKSIEPVLNAKARSAKGCFTEPQSSICGNGVVETGEECDCGWEEDCKDSCCFPMSRQARIDEKPCTLTPHARCSPSQGPCCTGDCKLKYGDKCRDDNGCRDPSFCDGRVPQCPPSVNKPNKTICNKEFVCYMGDCTGSICLAYGLESCQCIPGPNDDRIKSCELCCKLPGEGNPCRSSFEWNDPPFDVPDMYAKPGTPCNDYNGYCDVFQKCREVDPSGPLATLRKLLLSEESIATFKKWMQSNWYTVALAALGVFVLLIISTKLLAKRSNLKLKSVTIIHSATTETVRLPDNNNGVIVHTAVRTKVPFKKKVRGERSNNNNNKLKKTSKMISRTAKVTTPAALTGGVSKTTTATTVSNPVNDPKKPTRSKKKQITTNNNTNNANPTTAVTGGDEKPTNDTKKSKKFGKQIKEIIDYSHRNNDDAESTLSTTNNHTNTFGKVQKWLLESPIVAQPLSHIEHTSKVRKVISKSQSTPERLVQKTPQKTKSMGNLSNEKVKLQVVYKAPFKFSLRLSKKSKVKTHVVGGSTAVTSRNKRTTKNANRGSSSQHQLGKDIKSLYTDRAKRSALLLCNNDNEEDNQILTLNEPNYETLKSRGTGSGGSAEYAYENGDKSNLPEMQSHTKPSGSSSSSSKVAPSTSKTGGSTSANQEPHTQQRQLSQTSSYKRSNSLSSNNPFTVAPSSKRNSLKLKESNAAATGGGNGSAGGSINLNRNFGSTQNLINLSQNLAKSKKRSSLNLKTNVSKNGKDPPPPHRRSSSNMNLRRDSSGTSLGTNAQLTIQQQPHHHAQLQRTASSSANASLPQTHQHNPPLPAPRSQTRSSFSNIPRASLNLSATIVAANASNFGRQSSTATTAATSTASVGTPTAVSGSAAQHNLGGIQQSTSASAVFGGGAMPRRGMQPPMRRSLNNYHNKSNSNSSSSNNPKPSNNIPNAMDNNELPSDLEVVVSDIENLVS